MIQRIQHLNLEQEIGLKYMMNHEEHMIMIVILNMTIVMHTYMLKQLQQFKTLKLKVKVQIVLIKK